MVRISLEQGERFIKALTGCNRIQSAPESLITAETLRKRKEMAAIIKV